MTTAFETSVTTVKRLGHIAIRVKDIYRAKSLARLFSANLKGKEYWVFPRLFFVFAVYYDLVGAS